MDALAKDELAQVSADGIGGAFETRSFGPLLRLGIFFVP
jgi:hypothetical protein